MGRFLRLQSCFLGTPQEVLGVRAAEFGSDEEDSGVETELERIVLQDEERQV